MSSFDPYHKWLGIRDSQRPPNHYRLLGIELGESDPDVIAAAADRQMAHIRKYQSGERGELSQRILNEIAAAKICLLKDESRRTYDANLQSRQPLGEAQPSPNKTKSSRTARFVPALPRRRRGVAWYAGIASVMTLLIATPIILWQTGHLGPRLASTDTSTEFPAATPSTKKHPTTANEPDPDSSNAEPSASQDPTVDEPPVDPTPREDAPEPKQAESVEPATSDSNPSVEATLPPTTKVRPLPPWDLPRPVHRIPAPPSPRFADIFQDFLARSPGKALKKIRKFQTEPTDFMERDALRKLRLQADSLNSFWKSVDRGLLNIVAGDQLNYNDAPVTVLAIKRTGGKSTMELECESGEVRKFATSRKAIKGELALAIARWGRTSEPGGDLESICFLAMDRQGNSSLARQLGDVAARRGFPGQLMLIRTPASK